MQYTYEITKVDTENKHMEVTYSADGEQTYVVGMPMAENGVNLVLHINNYSPVPVWYQRTMEVQSVEVGDTGTIDTENLPIVE